MSLVHQNWWFTTLLVKPHKYCPPLNKSLKCDATTTSRASRPRQRTRPQRGAAFPVTWGTPEPVSVNDSRPGLESNLTKHI